MGPLPSTGNGYAIVCEAMTPSLMQVKPSSFNMKYTLPACGATCQTPRYKPSYQSGDPLLFGTSLFTMANYLIASANM